LTEAPRIDLDQSPVVRIAEPDFVTRALRRMGRPLTASLDYETARELAVREGLKAVVVGELRSVADGYLMSVRVMTARDGQVLTSLRETASDSLQITGAIGRLSRRLRQRTEGSGQG
jgi:hypothetical protein